MMAGMDVGGIQPGGDFKFEHTLSFSPSTTAALPIKSSPGSDTVPSEVRKQSNSRRSPSSSASSNHGTTQESPQHDVGFSFVNVGHPNEARGSSNKRAIRSHVAKVQHSKVRLSASVNKKSTAKARTNTRLLHPKMDPDTIDIRIAPSQTNQRTVKVNITFDGYDSSPQTTQPSESPEHYTDYSKTRQDSHFSTKALQHARTSQYDTKEEQAEEIISESVLVKTEPTMHADVPKLVRMLRGGRHDPFWTYPVPFHSHLERTIDHCKISI